MCRGKLFDGTVEGWSDFRVAAKLGPRGFGDVSTRAGVYVLRVAKHRSTDMTRVRKQFARSRFMTAATDLDQASESFFSEIGIGTGWGWTYGELSSERLDRLKRVTFEGGLISCPIVYIGKANNLRRRMLELATSGHTANAPFWAMLLDGWEIHVGFGITRKGAETDRERELKELYRAQHRDQLPALVQR